MVTESSKAVFLSYASQDAEAAGTNLRGAQDRPPASRYGLTKARCAAGMPGMG